MLNCLKVYEIKLKIKMAQNRKTTIVKWTKKAKINIIARQMKMMKIEIVKTTISKIKICNKIEIGDNIEMKMTICLKVGTKFHHILLEEEDFIVPKSSSTLSQI